MMQFICGQQDLSQGLTIVSHAVSTHKNTLPILGNILWASDSGKLKLSATNLAIGITCWIDAQIQGEGMLALPAKFMVEFVESLPLEPIQITISETPPLLGLTAPHTSATIKGVVPDEFPSISEAKEYSVPSALLDARLLKNMISYVTLAASTDESRPVLMGVLVQFENETLTLAAADSFRLAVRSVPLVGTTAPQQMVIIPARSLEELARILPAEGPVEMIIAPARNQVIFHMERIDFVSHLIDAPFPDFRQLLPSNYSTRAVVVTKELANALRCAALFAQDSSRLVQLKISPEAGTLTIEANAPDVGENQSIIAAHIQGAEQQVAFNVKYLYEALAVIESSQVAIELTAPTRPGIIRPIDSQDYVYAAMPLHIKPSTEAL